MASPLAQDAIGLRFQTENDTINYVKSVVQYAAGGDAARKTFGAGKANDEIEADIDFRDAVDYAHLTFGSALVPDRPSVNDIYGPTTVHSTNEVYAVGVNFDGKRGVMFCRVTDIAKAPKKVDIVSTPHRMTARAKFFKKSMKFTWDAPIRPLS